ncbi:DUF2239 family protein [Leucothrix pacifica]|uniref:DUF2239 domain-containing protein n=1 Tax=Leucothrix pacifica TaxID=1247513 RepID=A0A317C4X7_9GAMM|nr:DUF2239 family protein [Leucothrix pacifica]PWQ93261.1 DUF2239 domain-containing protein [Leucothrix pacifica]
MSVQYIAVHHKKLLAQGSLETLVNTVKAISNDIEPLVFALGSFKRIEINWHGDAASVLAGLPQLGDSDSASTETSAATAETTQEPFAPKKRGRPKLGVTSKEVTLLPRHWEWLASQRGGASVTLRRLIDEARKNPTIEEVISLKQQRLDGFMGLLFGDEAGYEEASRALFRNSRVSFEAAIAGWPDDLTVFVQEAFDEIAALHNGEIEKH